MGPNVPIPDTPQGIFRLFYTPTIIEMIVDQSNLYAESVMTPEKFATWEKITVADYEAFIAIDIAQCN